MCFEDWAPLLEKGKIADFAVIATMDRVHYEPAVAAIKAGYDLLLEKPIAPTQEQCVELVGQVVDVICAQGHARV